MPGRDALVQQVGAFALAPDALELPDVGATLPRDAIAGFGEPQVALDQTAIGRAVRDVDRAGHDAGDGFAAGDAGAVQLDGDVHRVAAFSREPDGAVGLHRAVASPAGKVAYLEPVIGKAAIKAHLRQARAECLIFIGQRIGADETVEARGGQATAEVRRYRYGSGQLLIGKPGEGEEHIGRSSIADSAAKGGGLELLRPA